SEEWRQGDLPMTGPIVFPGPRRNVLICSLAMIATLVVLPGVAPAADDTFTLLFGHRPDGIELSTQLTLRPNLLQPIYVAWRNHQMSGADVAVQGLANGGVREGGGASVHVPAERKALVPFGKAGPAANKDLLLMPMAGPIEIRVLNGDTVFQEVKVG